MFKAGSRLTTQVLYRVPVIVNNTRVYESHVNKKEMPENLPALIKVSIPPPESPSSPPLSSKLIKIVQEEVASKSNDVRALNDIQVLNDIQALNDIRALYVKNNMRVSPRNKIIVSPRNKIIVSSRNNMIVSPKNNMIVSKNSLSYPNKQLNFNINELLSDFLLDADSPPPKLLLLCDTLKKNKEIILTLTHPPDKGDSKLTKALVAAVLFIIIESLESSDDVKKEDLIPYKQKILDDLKAPYTNQIFELIEKQASWREKEKEVEELIKSTLPESEERSAMLESLHAETQEAIDMLEAELETPQKNLDSLNSLVLIEDPKIFHRKTVQFSVEVLRTALLANPYLSVGVSLVCDLVCNESLTPKDIQKELDQFVNSMDLAGEVMSEISSRDLLPAATLLSIKTISNEVDEVVSKKIVQSLKRVGGKFVVKCISHLPGAVLEGKLKEVFSDSTSKQQLETSFQEGNFSNTKVAVTQEIDKRFNKLLANVMDREQVFSTNIDRMQQLVMELKEKRELEQTTALEATETETNTTYLSRIASSIKSIFKEGISLNSENETYKSREANLHYYL